MCLRGGVAVEALGGGAGGEAAQEQVDGAAGVAGRIVDVAQAQAQPALHGDQVDQVLQVVVVGGDGLRAHGRGVVAETVGLVVEHVEGADVVAIEQVDVAVHQAFDGAAARGGGGARIAVFDQQRVQRRHTDRKSKRLKSSH